jgi:hypothetical protein
MFQLTGQGEGCIRFQSPDNKSASSSKGLFFMQSHEKKLAKKGASSNNKVAASDKVSKDNSKKALSLRLTEVLTKVFVEAMVEKLSCLQQIVG